MGHAAATVLPRLWSKIRGAQNNAPEIRGEGPGFKASLFKARFQGFWFQGQVLGFWVSRLGFRALGFKAGVRGFGFQGSDSLATNPQALINPSFETPKGPN